MAPPPSSWDDDDDWGKPLSQDPLDVEAREKWRRSLRRVSKRLLYTAYLVLAALAILVIVLAAT